MKFWLEIQIETKSNLVQKSKYFTELIPPNRSHDPLRLVALSVKFCLKIQFGLGAAKVSLGLKENIARAIYFTLNPPSPKFDINFNLKIRNVLLQSNYL